MKPMGSSWSVIDGRGVRPERRASTQTDVSARGVCVIRVVFVEDVGEGEVLGYLEVRHGAEHRHRFLLGHGLPHEVPQGVVDGLTLGLQALAHHDSLDELVVKVDVRARHADNRTPDWCMASVCCSGRQRRFQTSVPFTFLQVSLPLVAPFLAHFFPALALTPAPVELFPGPRVRTPSVTAAAS